jgi:hypothetical protein
MKQYHSKYVQSLNEQSVDNVQHKKSRDHPTNVSPGELKGGIA